jgi:hypothetical protein
MPETANTQPAQPPVTLNGAPTSQSALEETKKNLPGNQRIQEVKPGEHRVLTRMRD